MVAAFGLLALDVQPLPIALDCARAFLECQLESMTTLSLVSSCSGFVIQLKRGVRLKPVLL